MATSRSDFPPGPPLLAHLGRAALRGDWARILEYPGFLVQLALQRASNRQFQAIPPLVTVPPVPAAGGPLISILMPTFQTDLSMLQHATDSVREQPYGQWELIIVDDGSTSAPLLGLLASLQAADDRIKVIRADHQGIVGATNLALASAAGEWVAFMDHDDALAPGSLARVAQVLRGEPGADLLYTDECRIGPKGDLIEPAFKPCWSPETLLGVNYVCHWVVVRRDLLTEIGGFRDGTDGSQDHDLLLRLSQRARTVVHVREPLYHWRITKGSAGNLRQTHENGVKAVAGVVAQSGIPSQVLGGPFPCTYRVRPAGAPAFSLVIAEPEDRPISPHCLAAFEKGHATFGATEVILVGSAAAVESGRHFPWTVEDAPTHSVLDCIGVGIERAKSQCVVVLTRGSVPAGNDALSNLAAAVAAPRIALVSPMLLRAPHRIAAAGLAIDPERGLVARFAGHSRGTRLGGGGAQLIRDVYGATFDCAATTKAAWAAIGRPSATVRPPLDEVDWCLRAAANGYRIVYTPESAVEAPRFPVQAMAAAAPAPGSKPSFALPGDDPYLGRGVRLRRLLGREWAVTSVGGWKRGPPVVVWRDGISKAGPP